VIREADRLDRMMADPALLAPPSRARLRMEGINALLQEALQQHAEDLVRRRIRLPKKLAPDLPPLLLDPARMRRVVDNVLAHTLEAVAPGGRVRVESRRVQHHVVVEIANDGHHAGGELMDQLFVPFALGGSGADHVGLAAAQQLVRQHGGEVRVRSDGEWSAIFTILLPVRENGDRRRSVQERRKRAERRAPRTVR
jgi:signal transduction histidine kinase